MSENPQLFLFLSVDIIGSTETKYNKKISIEEWYTSFTDFYVSFPEEFRNHLESEYKYQRILNYFPEKLVVWKHAGDEILFYIEITQKGELPCIVNAFKKTLEDWYSDEEDKSDEENKMNVKGCVWTGQVPFIDRKIKEDDCNKFDFIGPSIDCGFRLGKHASKKEIVISVEVADLVNGVQNLQSSLYYLKSENLKGVLGDKEYPIFVLQLDVPKTNEYAYLKIPCIENNLDKYITEYYKEIAKDYEGMVSRIDENIPDYLESKKELSNKIEQTKTADQQKAEEITSGKKGDKSEYKEYEGLFYSSGDEIIAEP